LIALRAAAAYGKYVAGLTAIQARGVLEVDLAAELSDSDRAAAAAAESAAAYQKYVVGATAGGGMSDADRVTQTPTEAESVRDR